MGDTLCQNSALYLTLAGSEVYVGCSNGQLLRFALQADNPDTVSYRIMSLITVLTTRRQPESYTLLSRQSLPVEKPITDLVLIPCISRAMVLCGKSRL